MNIPEFSIKEDLFAYLRKNKALIITQKKAVMKLADPINNVEIEADEKTGFYTGKALVVGASDFSKLNAKLVINTTNIMDSHMDVHIPGLWSKTLKEKKERYLLKEHKMSFENIIADEIKASVIKMTWKELGYKFEGETEALVFDCTIEKDRNPYMAEQYAKGRVKQHSVGMQYVKLFLCMNSESKWDVEEKANWDKYYPMVANKDEADRYGFFYAVTEAKCIEGSAVPLGSNFATPTISLEPVIEITQATNESEEPTKSLGWDRLADALKAARLNNVN